jgi:hypothetical protein
MSNTEILIYVIVLSISLLYTSMRKFGEIWKYLDKETFSIRKLIFDCFNLFIELLILFMLFAYDIKQL